MATFSLRPLSLLLLCMLLLVLSLTHQSVVCLPTTDGAAPTTGPYSVAGVILHVPKPSFLRVQLTGNVGLYEEIPSRDGSFRIDGVHPGAYLLNVVSMEYNFTTIRVDVSARHNGKVKARYLNDNSNVLAYPLRLAPFGGKSFLVERPPFDVWGLIKNPMVLMVVLSVGVMLLFQFVDLEEMQRQLAQEQAGGTATAASATQQRSSKSKSKEHASDLDDDHVGDEAATERERKAPSSSSSTSAKVKKRQ